MGTGRQSFQIASPPTIHPPVEPICDRSDSEPIPGTGIFRLEINIPAQQSRDTRPANKQLRTYYTPLINESHDDDMGGQAAAAQQCQRRRPTIC